MSAINTGSHPKLLWPGIHAIWGQIYAEHEAQYTSLYDIESSSKAYEEDVQVTGFGLAQIKAQGASVSYDTESQGGIQRYQHIAYALGYMVTKEERDDDLYEVVGTRRAKANAFSMNQTVENIGAFPYNNAFATTYFTTADGASLVSTAHVNPTGGTFSNALSPAASLSETALEDIVIQIRGAQNSRGLQISVMPKTLIIPRQEEFNAMRILQSVAQSGSANNDINALRASGAFPGGVKVNTYLTDPNAWFVRTNVMSGMQLFWRTKPEFSQDNDFDTENSKAKSYMRLSVGCTDPLGIFGSAGG